MSKSRNRPFTNFSTCLPIVTKPNHQFLSDLLRYSRPTRHDSSFVPPSLCGRNIDLRALYNEVAIRGGHKQVTSLHQWNEVYMALGFPMGCVDAGHGLRTIYQRFLESFERTQRMAVKSAFATDDLDSSLCVDTDSQDLEAIKGAKHVMPTDAPSPKAEDIPNHLRDSWNLSTDLSDRVDYISLERSLRSNLPNEVDFALNTMLLMSSQPNGFNLYKNERLLGLLLQSVGIIAPDYWANGHLDDYATAMQNRFHKFWCTNISGSVGRTFLVPESFDIAVECEVEFGTPDACYSACFSKLHDMAYGDDEGFRVQLVATVIRNLAVEGGPSAVIIGRDPQALRFIFLCVYNSHCSLRQLGLETLSSLHFPVMGRLGPVLHILISNLMTSPDRNDQMRGLQLIGRLCEAPLSLARHNRCPLGSPNEGILTTRGHSVLANDRNASFLSTLPSVVFERLVKTLCLRDLHLVVLGLDAVYNLSCLGRVLCERMLCLSTSAGSFPSKHRSESTNCLLQILVALLRLEAQAMGSESMVRLRVMQALSASSSSNNTITTSATTASVSSKSIASTASKPRTTPAPPAPPSPLSVSSIPLPQPTPSSQLPPFPITTTTISNRPDPIPTITTANSQSNMVPLPLTLASSVMAGQTAQAASSPAPSHTLSLESRSIVMMGRPVSQSEISIPIPVVSRPVVTHSLVSTPRLPNTPTSMAPFSIGVVTTSNCSSPACTFVADPKPSEDPIRTVSITSSPLPQTSASLPSNPDPHMLAIVSSTPIDYPTVSSTASSKQNSTPKTEPSELSTTILNRVPIRPQFRPHASRLHRAPRPRKPQLSLSDKNINSHSTAPYLEYMFEWLQRNYVVHNHSSVSRVQIYIDYQRAHQRRFGTLTTAVSPVDFHTLIKSVFPGVGQVKVQVPGDKVIIHYNNLRCLKSPESNTEQGVNDIMAAVLSPTKQNEVSVPKRPSKSKSRKRPNPQPLVSVAPTKQMTTWPQSNGHNENKQLVNGCVLEAASNGLTKGLVGLITHPVSSAHTNGTMTPTQTSPVKLSGSTLPPCPKLNELVSREHGLVLFPVFTTLNFNPTHVPALSNHTSKAALEPPRSVPNPDGPVSPTSTSQSRSTLPAPEDGVKQNPDVVKPSPVIPKPLLTPRPILARKTIPVTSTTSGTPPNPSPYLCHWSACTALCKDLNTLLIHLWSDHLSSLTPKQPLSCSWTVCDHKDKLETAEQLRAHVYRKHIKPLSQSIVNPVDTVILNGTMSGLPASTRVTVSRSCTTCSVVSTTVMNTVVTKSVPSSTTATSSATEVRSSMNPSSDNHLFRHPSTSASETPQSVKVESRERLPISCPMMSEAVTPTTVTAQSSLVSSISAVHTDSYDPLGVIVLAKPTVWCSPPVLSDECRRAMAGGASNPVFDLTPSREGPVTKHIRLTAALTLKNLLRFSQIARNFMIPREELLSELAFSGLESSPTIFECLIYLNESSNSGHSFPRTNLIPPFV
ncbi:AT-rich interactive domain-containing protein 2 [Fasciola hepatica]|uniref:AT-rich interactive domain-containing protein 2 n=1 Tax=Fasciola hepatica TaxID=6192 RepID=A0A4E0RAS0_FASHE|nr:AT-rich interactive domain-containing protein 2 [Fasciola hepatica]